MRNFLNVGFPALFLVLGGLLVVSLLLSGSLGLGQIRAASNSPSCWNYDQTADNWTQTDCGLRGDIVNNCLVIDGGFAICNGTGSPNINAALQQSTDGSCSSRSGTWQDVFNRIFGLCSGSSVGSSPVPTASPLAQASSDDPNCSLLDRIFGSCAIPTLTPSQNTSDCALYSDCEDSQLVFRIVEIITPPKDRVVGKQIEIKVSIRDGYIGAQNSSGKVRPLRVPQECVQASFGDNNKAYFDDTHGPAWYYDSGYSTAEADGCEPGVFVDDRYARPEDNILRYVWGKGGQFIIRGRFLSPLKSGATSNESKLVIQISGNPQSQIVCNDETNLLASLAADSPVSRQITPARLNQEVELTKIELEAQNDGWITQIILLPQLQSTVFNYANDWKSFGVYDANGTKIGEVPTVVPLRNRQGQSMGSETSLVETNGNKESWLIKHMPPRLPTIQGSIWNRTPIRIAIRPIWLKPGQTAQLSLRGVLGLGPLGTSVNKWNLNFAGTTCYGGPNLVTQPVIIYGNQVTLPISFQ